mmetsp:Transcript_714/g.853  ORF Transcript_714/g.853 Transcript_714/m.853 type:complete len:255 (-) Transcript_714:8-772(-)
MFPYQLLQLKPIVWTRYPWLCGYLVAPILYWVAENYVGTTCFRWASPLHSTTTAPADILAICWHFHFLRRTAEVLFLNTYHGKGIPNERDSVLEFVYYSTWGIINGCTGACVRISSSTTGANNKNALLSSSPVVLFGLVLFGLSEFGNFLCHAHLKSLRSDPKDTSWKIPYRWPFSIIAAPHYTFELMSWWGYVLMAGFSPPSLFIFGMSCVFCTVWSKSRKEKYIQLYNKSDDKKTDDSSSPENRWALIPFLY